MGNALPLPGMTTAEFIAWDDAQEARHELIDGEVYSMTEATSPHHIVTRNIDYALNKKLMGTPCIVYRETFKLKVADDQVYCPDVMVVCGRQGKDGPTFVTEPRLVVEVLSPSTESTDRVEKFDAYWTMESLEEYVMVDPIKRTCQVYRRAERNMLTMETYVPLASLELQSVGLTIRNDDLWRDVLED